MKLFYVITMSNWGGAQAHLYDLVKNAINQKNECVVVLGEPGELADRLKELGVKIIILKSLKREINVVQDMKCVFALTRILLNEKPDLIHAHSSKAGIIARIAAKLTSTPVVFTAHGWAFTEGVSEKKRKLFILIEKSIARFTNKIICVSEYDRQLAIQNKVAEPTQLITIVNGVEVSKGKLNNNIEVNNGRIKIIMVARFSSQKDYETLTLALSEVKGDFEALYVGEGELQFQIKELVKEKKLDQKINFLGMRKDVLELLEKSDIFVLSSNYEGLPISIIEAMSKSLPIVASDVGGIKELVEDGETGYLIGKKDYTGLAEKLQFLLDHPEERKKMGQASYQKYENEFSLALMLEKTFSVYHEVLQKNKNSNHLV